MRNRRTQVIVSLMRLILITRILNPIQNLYLFSLTLLFSLFNQKILLHQATQGRRHTNDHLG